MAALLVTLTEAKAHLRITTPDGDPGDADVQAKLDAAEATILDYCNTAAYWRGITATWTPETVPRYVHAAILLQLGELDRFRGDDLEGAGPPRETGEDVSPAVRSLLRRTHDAVLG